MTVLTFTLGMITGFITSVICYFIWVRNEAKKYTENELKDLASKGAKVLNIKLKDDPLQNSIDAWERYRKEKNNK